MAGMISRYRLARAIGSIGVAVAFLVLLSTSPASALTTTILVPTSYVTTHGSDSGTPVSALDVLDEAGLTSSPAKFVQFRAKTAGTTYAGYRTYTLPTSIRATSITQIQLRVNYRGPVRGAQMWTWSICDWANGGFFPVGDNFFAPPSSPWTILSFNLGGNNLANYVRASDRRLRVRVLSNNTAGDADLDYEALAVTSTSKPPPRGGSFYVSPSGNDANPGTRTRPWRTISKAAITLTPGSTVYVRAGVYHERVCSACRAIRQRVSSSSKAFLERSR